MHAPAIRINRFHQRISIGGFQLGQLAIIQNRLGDCHAIGGQIFQHICPGRPGTCLGFFTPFQPHLIKQNLAQLFGRGDIKTAACLFMDNRFQLDNTGSKII